VEGSSDYHAIRNLWLKRGGAPEAFALEVRNGLPDLRDQFRGSLLGSEIVRLGVVVDADDSAERRWPGFRQALVDRGYRPVPKTIPPEGLVLQRPELTVPTVGVWIMPDNTSPGRLEDFLHYLVRPGDSLWDRAGDAIDQLPVELRRFKDAYRTKAQMHTWLAWQKEPGMRMGQAVTRGVLDPRSSNADIFVAWLRRLTSDEPVGTSPG
jgi:hypothetical protein